MIPNFYPEDKCVEVNQKVVAIVRSMVNSSEKFNHTYTDQGHIGIREMKPSEKIENIEDEMSKVFRLHHQGIFNEFIKREDLLNMLEDGQRINWKDTEQWNMPMEEYTLVNGKKANDMVKALCHIPMGESGKESGQAIN